MHLYVSAYSYITFVTGIILIFVTEYVWRKRASAGAQYFTYLMMATTIWSIAAAIEASVGTMPASVFWSKISYLGIVFIGPMWLLFTLEYSNYNEKVIQIVRNISYALAIFFLILVCSNELHYTFWSSYNRIGGDFGTTIYGHGIAFYFHLILEYLMILAGIGILLRSISKSRKGTYSEKVLNIVSVLLPLLGNVVYVIAPGLVASYDITPLLFSFTTIIIVINFYRFKFYYKLPEIQDAIYKNLGSGIILIDSKYKILDINEVAIEMLGKKAKIGSYLNKIDKPILEEINNSESNIAFCPSDDKWYEIRKYPIKNFSNIKDSTVIFIYDVTNRKKVMNELEESKFLLNTVLDFMPDVIFAIDLEGKLTLWNKKAEEVTGVKAEEILGTKNEVYSKRIYGKNRPLLINLVLSKKIVQVSNYNGIEKNGDTLTTYGEYKGSTYWFVARPLYDQEGNIIGAIESGRNIDDQLKKQGELEERVDTLMKLNDILVKREERISDMSEEIERLKHHSSDSS